MTPRTAKQIGIKQARKIARVTICRMGYQNQYGNFELFEFTIISTPITARTRKFLLDKFTFESDQEIEMVHGPLR
jgi:hypothetical protein